MSGIAIDSDVPIDPVALVAAGVTDIGRYLATLTRAEVDGYHAHGIAVWLIWELAATAALGGAGQGALDAQGALRALLDLGAPKGIAPYFAWDADPGSPPDPRGLEYFRTTGTLMRQAGFRNGSYAGAPAQLAGLAARTIDLAWGPGATSWDHGLVVPQRVLQQGAMPDSVAGIPVDADAVVRAHSVLAADFGQWAPPAPVTTPTKPPSQPEEDDVKAIIVPHPTLRAKNVCVTVDRAYMVPDEPAQAWLESQGATLGAGVEKATVPAPAEPPASLIDVLLG